MEEKLWHGWCSMLNIMVNLSALRALHGLGGGQFRGATWHPCVNIAPGSLQGVAPLPDRWMAQ